MKRDIKDFYSELASSLERIDPLKMEEFRHVTKIYSPKEVYEWLEENIEKQSETQEFNEVMTDFFYYLY